MIIWKRLSVFGKARQSKTALTAFWFNRVDKEMMGSDSYPQMKVPIFCKTTGICRPSCVAMVAPTALKSIGLRNHDQRLVPVVIPDTRIEELIS
jgi:hypothetical protein